MGGDEEREGGEESGTEKVGCTFMWWSVGFPAAGLDSVVAMMGQFVFVGR